MRTTSRPLCALALGLSLAACDQAGSAPTPVLAVQGAAIDGSEDPRTSEPPSSDAQPVDVVSVTPDEDAAPAAPVGGVLAITYQDLSLVDYDVDAMLDYMLFPEEYDEDDAEYLAFPEELTSLMDREVTIIGYMIPGEMDQGEVTDFMLVRDLLGCCFGGSPMPDEWIDVLMAEGETAEYRPYLPMRVTGTLTLGGEQDEAGFAMGIYKMIATDVHVED